MFASRALQAVARRISLHADVRIASAFSTSVVMQSARPENVGIHKMDIYFPSTYVNQGDLEKHDKVSEGKYTKGLGLNNMAFCNDREDIASMCLTAVSNFMEKHNVSYKDIGRLEVGTETLIDKSKATKTTLMQLFQESGNTSVEGIDNLNACYGGTQALLNSTAWVESSGWDGRYGMIVCGDIAVYEKGPARPTGGAGVVVMLVGPDAPIALEASRHSYFEHAYDFYKPNLDSEYPVVDGHLSINCYLRALDYCYRGYVSKFEKAHGGKFDLLKNTQHALFHSPFVKLTRKAWARMFFNDMLRNPSGFDQALHKFADLDVEKSYGDRDLEKAFTALSTKSYDTHVEPTALFAAELGNSYTGSLYASLVSSLMRDDDAGRRLLMFSYGSGLASTMFSLNVRKSAKDVINTTEIENRLLKRTRVPPQQYEEMLAGREAHGLTGSVDGLFPGTFYLSHVDKMKRRFYKRA
eukprot:TRINITY_DN4394_c0_g1_i1.p1 TRINITY_DN4394_c0_g1~~TRINITY_DN4394_c0_g1_i1.p1  ORF type:complete len:468 (-),score=101.51 TRINITY_DN4394_c0_g1_i1:121-1524(-)